MRNLIRRWLGLEKIDAGLQALDRRSYSLHLQFQVYLADKISTDESRKELKRIADLMEGKQHKE